MVLYSLGFKLINMTAFILCPNNQKNLKCILNSTKNGSEVETLISTHQHPEPDGFFIGLKRDGKTSDFA